MARTQHAPATTRTLPAALYSRGRRYLQHLGRLLASRNSRMGDRRPRNGSED